jgi:hypothetical protein
VVHVGSGRLVLRRTAFEVFCGLVSRGGTIESLCNSLVKFQYVREHAKSAWLLLLNMPKKEGVYQCFNLTMCLASERKPPCLAKDYSIIIYHKNRISKSDNQNDTEGSIIRQLAKACS